MGSSGSQALLLIVTTLGNLLVLAILLRFLLQAARADYYNPVSQAIAKVTTPVTAPLRRFIPPWRSIDIASFVVALIISTIASSIMISLAGFALPAITTIIIWCFLGLCSFILNIYFYGLLVSIVASWIAPNSGNPVLLLIHQLLDPIQSRVQKVIPPLGGLDFSPIFTFLGIQLVDIMLVQSFAQGMRLPRQFVIGI